MAPATNLVRLGKTLRDHRKRLRLSQREVGELVGKATGKTVTGSAVGNWERGKDEPTRQNVEALEDIFDAPGELSQHLSYTIARRPRKRRRPVVSPAGTDVDVAALRRQLAEVRQTLERLDAEVQALGSSQRSPR